MSIESECSKSVYIIIPVYNRRDVTLRCLDCLKKQMIFNDFGVIIVDDGSTDSTSAEIKAQYPETHIITGDGSLWWAGAIRKGMEYAYQKGAKYFIWMNDDTVPISGTLPLMLEYCSQTSNTIVSGQCYQDENLKFPTYGGQKKNILSITLFYTPIGQYLSCDCMSGNLVCFPRSVIDKIGLPPNDLLPHNMADIVYTWEAKKAGYQLMVCGDATAVCELNPYEEGWASSPIPMFDRWQKIMSYKSNLYPPAFWYYCRRFYGVLAPIAFLQAYVSLCLFTVARYLLPLSVLAQIKKMKERVSIQKMPNKVVRDHQTTE
jgi:GT2 family glycosyltransferase